MNMEKRQSSPHSVPELTAELKLSVVKALMTSLCHYWGAVRLLRSGITWYQVMLQGVYPWRMYCNLGLFFSLSHPDHEV
jgi:hypothetical protein